MILLVGLGNPGAKFANNRHNIGFMAVDEIVRRHGLGPWRKRFQGEVAEGRIGAEKVMVLKPMTYMNESGRSVGEAVRFFDLEPDDVVVFHDELDLPAGKPRMKTGGGHAGHNGLRSIQAHIGAGYHRARLGIGHPGDKSLVHGYVLKDFAKADRVWVGGLIDAIADAAPLLAERQIASFQNKVHLTLNREPPDTPDPARKAKPSGDADAKPAPKPSGPFAALKSILSGKGGD